MIDTMGTIAFRDHKLSETATLHLALRSTNGMMYLDARKWLKYPNVDEYLPSRKGVTVKLEDWEASIPLIQELIAEGKGKL